MESISSDEAAALSGTYRLLARLWLREVDVAFLRELRSPPLCDSFAEVGGIVPAGDDDRTIEQLAIDHCRLFVGPTDHLPPYQSVWQSGQFQSTAAVSIKKFIEVVGYDTNALPSGMMLDHLGVQLDVMGHILGQFSAWQAVPNNHKLLTELVHTFSTAHLLWTTELLEAASRRATTDFYRSVIMLTRAFLTAEMQA